MSKIRVLLVSALILALSVASARAATAADGDSEKANVDVLLSAIRANRKALVAVNLKMTDEEAAKFWPVYDSYQKEMNALGDRLVALLGDYGKNFKDMSDDKAMKILDEYLNIEAERVKVRRSYVEQFAKALPGRKVGRFYQIENKMDAVIRYEMAKTIPVVEDESAAPAK
jgi:hypothetical protein